MSPFILVFFILFQYHFRVFCIEILYIFVKLSGVIIDCKNFLNVISYLLPEKHNNFVLNNLAEVFIISSNLSEMVFLSIPKPWRVFAHQDSIFPHSKLYMLLSLYIIILLYFKSYTLLLLLDAERFHLDVIINNPLFFVIHSFLYLQVYLEMFPSALKKYF